MLKLPRISPAGVIATGALFLSLGGGAALAATAIDGNTVKDRSLPGVKIVKHTVGSNELKQPTLHYIGTPGAAAFQNGWQAPNLYDANGQPGYMRDASGVVHFTGEGGVPGRGADRDVHAPARVSPRPRGRRHRPHRLPHQRRDADRRQRRRPHVGQDRPW